ncbi:glycosyltransferase family 4 protein [Pseudonocardia nigra]|uniref:glycosyltransferase family 4 protein n=1 Tax=Pseudonocardia nigra TaxID=1921578 RepID=UPI001C606EF9|nr:glycosyltransferase family 4 protein [Pseudonocardia nigra]
MSAGTAIYVVTDPGVPAFGAKGCSVHVQEVLRELCRRHRIVHLITTRPGGDAPADLAGVVVHPLPRPCAAGLAEREAAQRAADDVAAAMLTRLCRENAVTLVYQRYALWSAATLEAARLAGVPTVLEINAPLLREQAEHRGLHDADAAHHWSVRALEAADAPFAVAGPVARWAERLDPRQRSIPVVGNGVDVRRFTPAPRRLTAEPVVAFAGTFKPWHGLELLVDAVAAARAAGPGLRLLLVGDGPELAATVTRAQDAGVPVIATGQLDPSEVPGWLRGADLAAAPYPAGDHYFSPLKVAEYLAAGLPTVASAIADLPGLVADGVEALLVPPGDVRATAAAVARLAGDPGLRSRMARAGRRAAEQRMSWTAVVDATLRLLPAVVLAQEVG